MANLRSEYVPLIYVYLNFEFDVMECSRHPNIPIRKDYSNCSVKSFSIDSIVLNNGKLTRKFQS